VLAVYNGCALLAVLMAVTCVCWLFCPPRGHAGHYVLVVQLVQLLLERQLLSRPAGCSVFLACTSVLITSVGHSHYLSGWEVACTSVLITSVGHSHYLSGWEVACTSVLITSVGHSHDMSGWTVYL
jgi:hypothetical protein